MLESILKQEKVEVPDRNAKGWKAEGEQRRVTRTECFMAQEDRGCMAENVGKQRSDAQGRKAIQSEYTRPCTRIMFSVVG